MIIKNNNAIHIDNIGDRTFPNGHLIYTTDGNIYMGKGIGQTPLHLASKEGSGSSNNGGIELPEPTTWTFEVLENSTSTYPIHEWTNPIANKNGVMAFGGYGSIAQKNSSTDPWTCITPSNLSTRSIGQSMVLNDGTILFGEPTNNSAAQYYIYEMNGNLQTWQTITQSTTQRPWIFTQELPNGDTIFMAYYTGYVMVRKANGTYASRSEIISSNFSTSGFVSCADSTAYLWSSGAGNMVWYNPETSSFAKGQIPLSGISKAQPIGFSKSLNKAIFLTTTAIITKDIDQEPGFVDGWDSIAISDVTLNSASIPNATISDDGKFILCVNGNRNPTRISIEDGVGVVEDTTITFSNFYPFGNGKYVYHDRTIGNFAYIRDLDGIWNVIDMGTSIHYRSSLSILNNRLYFGVIGSLIQLTSDGKVSAVSLNQDTIPCQGGIAPDGTLFFGTKKESAFDAGIFTGTI